MVTTDHPMYDFDRASMPLQGLPPIVGADGGSAWFRTPLHVQLDALSFPETLAGGLYLRFDIHLDSRAEQVVLGTSTTAKAALIVRANSDHVPGRVSLSLRDDDGRRLEAHADGSRSIARRIIVLARPAEDTVTFYEIEPWASPSPTTPLVSHHTIQESPARFTFASPAALGGWYEDGVIRGPFAGRMSEVSLGLGQPRVEALAAASDNPTGLTHSDLQDPSPEILDLFKRGVQRLRSWAARPMGVDDMEAASLLMYSWLFESTTTPVLVRLARCYGVQLWMPGAGERTRMYEDAVLQDRPTVLLQGGRGPGHAMDFSWVTLDEWRRQPVVHAHGRPVTAEQLIKLVRNKLGAGHFDETNRQAWQKTLLEVVAGLELNGEAALVFQMHELAMQVLLAVSVTRLESLARTP
jgi:hypothetical protein